MLCTVLRRRKNHFKNQNSCFFFQNQEALVCKPLFPHVSNAFSQQPLSYWQKCYSLNLSETRTLIRWYGGKSQKSRENAKYRGKSEKPKGKVKILGEKSKFQGILHFPPEKVKNLHFSPRKVKILGENSKFWGKSQNTAEKALFPPKIPTR